MTSKSTPIVVDEPLHKSAAVATESETDDIEKGTSASFQESSNLEQVLLSDVSHHKAYFHDIRLSLCFDAAALTFLGFVDSSVLVQMYATCYWHLMNVFNLGFDVQPLIAALLAFILLPSLFFIPKVFAFFQSERGNSLGRVVTFVFFLLSLQIHESVRTFFTALSTSFVLMRIYTATPSFERLSFSAGFWLMVLVRWSNASIHPLDLPDRLYPMYVFSILGVASLIRLELPICQLRCNRKRIHPGVYALTQYNRRTAGLSLGYSLFLGIGGAFAFSMAGSMLLLGLSSDTIAVRWNELQSAHEGCLFVLFLLLGVILHAFILCRDASAPAGGSRNIRLFAFAGFLLGGLLAVFLRGGAGGFIGILFLSVTVFTVMDCALVSFQLVVHDHSNRRRSCLACGFAVPVGIWFTLNLVFTIGWFAGPMIPFFGTLFWSNEVALWLLNIVPAGLLGACCVLFSTSVMRDITFASEEKQRKFHVLRFGVLKDSWNIFSAFGWVLVFVTLVVFLPALRLRTYNYESRGSLDTLPGNSDKFNVMTWNLQQGYAIGKGTIGYQSLDRISDIIKSVGADVVGFQETDSANPLHGNRDILGFIADATHSEAFYGPPAYTSTPGVSILSSRALSQKFSIILERGDEALRRLLIGGYFTTRKNFWNEPVVIQVLNTHISAFSDQARKLQIREIVEYVRGTTGPLILTGDFNNPPNKTLDLWSSVGAPLKLVQLGRDMLKTENLPATETASYAHIDHIYYRDLCFLEGSIVEATGISDHLPVVASFRTHDDSGKRCTTHPVTNA